VSWGLNECKKTRDQLFFDSQSNWIKSLTKMNEQNALSSEVVVGRKENEKNK
jgi:hypothetical protein